MAVLIPRERLEEMATPNATPSVKLWILSPVMSSHASGFISRKHEVPVCGEEVELVEMVAGPQAHKLAYLHAECGSPVMKTFHSETGSKMNSTREIYMLHYTCVLYVLNQLLIRFHLLYHYNDCFLMCTFMGSVHQ